MRCTMAAPAGMTALPQRSEPSREGHALAGTLGLRLSWPLSPGKPLNLSVQRKAASCWAGERHKEQKVTKAFVW